MVVWFPVHIHRVPVRPLIRFRQFHHAHMEQVKVLGVHIAHRVVQVREVVVVRSEPDIRDTHSMSFTRIRDADVAQILRLA